MCMYDLSSVTKVTIANRESGSTAASTLLAILLTVLLTVLLGSVDIRVATGEGHGRRALYSRKSKMQTMPNKSLLCCLNTGLPDHGFLEGEAL